jgi:hypothetical protein
MEWRNILTFPGFELGRVLRDRRIGEARSDFGVLTSGATKDVIPLRTKVGDLENLRERSLAKELSGLLRKGSDGFEKVTFRGDGLSADR